MPPGLLLEAVVHGLQVGALHAADGVSGAHLIVVVELGVHVSLRGKLPPLCHRVCRRPHRRRTRGWRA
jgi:hypothetical protein